MAWIEVPGGPCGEEAMVWTGRPPMDAMVGTMVGTVAGRSILPAAGREPARMRIARLDACGACATDRAPSVVAAGVDEDAGRHLDEYRDDPGDTERRRLSVEFAERFATDHAADHAADPDALVDRALVDNLRRAFADEEILDRTLCVAVHLGLGRAPAVPGIDEHAPDEA